MLPTDYGTIPIRSIEESGEVRAGGLQNGSLDVKLWFHWTIQSEENIRAEKNIITTGIYCFLVVISF